ncbi:hypothetical protein TrVFT333_002527 [Trichoderma virens FT-333]|nr:hypothetical protein TrVFT333_002527 [Trichoderma virens FT-333]
MSAQEYYNNVPSSDGNPPQYNGQQQYNGNCPQQEGTSQQPSQAPPSKGCDVNLDGQIQYRQPGHDGGTPYQSIPFMQQSPNASGERGLGATLIGGGVGAFAAKKSGGGLLGTLGGAAAGAIEDTREENTDMVAVAVIDTTALCI